MLSMNHCGIYMRWQQGTGSWSRDLDVAAGDLGQGEASGSWPVPALTFSTPRFGLHTLPSVLVRSPPDLCLLAVPPCSAAGGSWREKGEPPGKNMHPDPP